ncbi:hypothetical protein [Demequina mangrovi]|nr:hypothetical protein [Demequina mangrovi]
MVRADVTRVRAWAGRRGAADLATALLWASFGAALVRNLMNLQGARWALTDWAINYEAGFVRRGLFGQVALELSRATGLSLVVIAASVSIVAFASLLTLGLMATRRRLLRPWAVPSAALLGGAVYFETNILRKDVLLLALMAASLAVLGSRMRLRWKLVGVNVAAVTAVLIHESFLAVCLPALTVVAWALIRRAGADGMHRLASYVALAPAWAAGCAVTVFSVPPRGVDVVWGAWFEGGASTGMAGAVPDVVTHALDALTWDAQDAVGLSASALGSRGAWLWFPILAVAVAVTIASMPRIGAGAGAEGLWPGSQAALVVVVVGGSGMLWVAGIDWGRWIVLACMTLAMVWCWHVATSPSASAPQRRAREARVPRWVIPAALLFFSTGGFAEWSVRDYVSATPIVQIPVLAWHVLEGLG